MIPLYLSISDFFSHRDSELDFTGFSSALIMGKQNENDLVSNGVGKSTIFKSIEWVLFNQVRDPLLQKDIVLDRLIRDEAQKVSVIFDFAINDDIYRIIRVRTHKGISDLSLFKRNAVPSDLPLHIKETDKKLWDNISGRRASDTEADLSKIIKSNHKSFIATCHFMQGDLSGIAAATPEKRKTLLKEVLELTVYSKLEVRAKEKADELLKCIDRDRLLLTSLGDPKQDIAVLEKELAIKQVIREEKENELVLKKNKLVSLNEQYTMFLSQLNVLESQSASILHKHRNLISDVSTLQERVQEYTIKRKEITTSSKLLIQELENLKNEQQEIGILNIDEVNQLLLIKKQISKTIQDKQIELATIDAELKKWSIPLPADGTCSHCRQILTIEHRQACIEKLKTQKEELNNRKNTVLINMKEDEQALLFNEEQLSLLSAKKQKLDRIERDVISKEQELKEKKKVYTEFAELVEKFIVELANKKPDLATATIEVENSSAKEINELREQMVQLKETISQSSLMFDKDNQLLNENNSKIAVISFSIEQKTKDIVKKEELQTAIATAENAYTIYPSIIQAFGSSGIPNFIIQNVLEDLQAEANNLLAQIRPGLQLSFSTEKIKGDGGAADTLDLTYYLNNKSRDYSVLSGAQRLCIAFSLKLGLSFLLAKMLGSQVKMLLLDEIDSSLDKASIDAYANIIRLFQNQFKILVISHNDRLIDLFKNIILVEQDQNMVSTARVLTR